MSGQQESGGMVSRRRLQGAAFGAAAAFAGAHGAFAWPSVPAPVSREAASPDSLFLALSSAPKWEFAAGDLRVASSASMPALDGLSIATLTLRPGSEQELHWHDNASELTHVRSGSGVAIILYDGKRSVVPLQPGTLIFFPQGSAHVIWNAGDEPMDLIFGFNSENPETINFSTLMQPIPSMVLAQTAGVAPGEIPFLPAVGPALAVPVTGDPPEPTADASESATLLDMVEVEVFAGGTRRLADTTDIPRMTGIKFTVLTLAPGGARLPHWHPQMGELAYCLAGSVQMGIIGPDGAEQSAVMAAGDVAFVPLNWLHYISNIGENEATVVLYHNKVEINFIDLADVMSAFPPETLSASFGLGGDAFAGFAAAGSPIIAARAGS